MTDGNELNIKWVSDLIGNEYQEWFGKKILIGCGTGRGKTTFALEHYCKWLLSQNKTILYICNRTKLRKQINTDIKKRRLVGIEVISYQKFKDRIEHNDRTDYDIYICDEAHYFLADAEFNIYTDIPYEFILNKENATVLYMTATYWNIQAKLKTDLSEKGEELLEYFLPTDYSYVKRFCWYQKPQDLFGIVDRILNRTEDKIIYFCNSGKKMREFYEHYDPTDGKDTDNKELLEQSKLKDMVFLCSETSNNSWMKKHCSDNAIKECANGGFTFDSRMLITTKVIDNGIDFKDQKIKHIICDVFDIETAIQCLGRKRILNDNDTCTFYLRDWQSYQLNIFYSGTVKELKIPQLFLEDREQWEQTYGLDRELKDRTVYYDFRINDFNINPLRYCKLLSDEEIIRKMMKKKLSYRTMISNRLGKLAFLKSKDLSDIEADIVRSDIDIFLEKHENSILTKDEQAELVELCKLKDGRGRQQKAVNIIGAYIEENFKPYTVTSERVMVDGKRSRKWVLRKNEK